MYSPSICHPVPCILYLLSSPNAVHLPGVYRSVVKCACDGLVESKGVINACIEVYALYMNQQLQLRLIRESTRTMSAKKGIELEALQRIPILTLVSLYPIKEGLLPNSLLRSG